MSGMRYRLSERDEETEQSVKEDKDADRGSDVSSQQSEGAMKVQREIEAMIGANLNVVPVDIDFSVQRKMVHTPKDGMIKHEGDDYYMEHIVQNEYLRSFLDDYEQRLNSNLDDHVKKIHRSELKHYMKTHSPIRQARENVKQLH